MSPRPIVLCADASAYSSVACRYAAWLSKRMGKPIEGLYVSSIWNYDMPFLLDLGGSLGASPYQAAVVRLEELEKEKAELIHQAMVKSLDDAGVSQFEFSHQTGMLVDSLKQLEEENKVGLIVMGKRGENANMAKGHLGGNLERVARTVKVPCFVANRKYCEIKRVVLAYDDGPSSRNAVKWLLEHRFLSDLDVHVVSVNEETTRNTGTLALEAARQQLEAAGVHAKYQLLTGQVAHEISEYVTHNDTDLLITGAYGHSRIRELFIGSTTTELMRKCRIAFMLFH